jgi:hypothetical protein
MAIIGQLDSETLESTAHSAEFEALQALLVAQGETLSYEEAADFGYELLGFFQALGEENEPTEASHA